jgi:hypothetical protein
VTVTGSSFVASTHLRCKFDDYIVNATFLSATTARCVTPPHAAGLVAVEVSNNNQDYTTDATPYTYDRTRLSGSFKLSVSRSPRVASLVLTSIWPANGPIGGGTEGVAIYFVVRRPLCAHGSAVTIAGYEFLTGAVCKFGTVVDTGSTTVTSTQLKCVTPPQTLVTPYNATVEVTNNNQDYTILRRVFTYFRALRGVRAPSG